LRPFEKSSLGHTSAQQIPERRPMSTTHHDHHMDEEGFKDITRHQHTIMLVNILGERNGMPESP